MLEIQRAMDAERGGKKGSGEVVRIRQYTGRLESSKRASTAGPRGLIGPYLVVIKAPAAAISDRENEQHCSAGERSHAAPFRAYIKLRKDPVLPFSERFVISPADLRVRGSPGRVGLVVPAGDPAAFRKAARPRTLLRLRRVKKRRPRRSGTFTSPAEADPKIRQA